MTLETVKTLAEIAASAATALGIVGAGFWSFVLFRRRRQQFPRVAISHQTHCLRLPDGRTVLRVFARIANTGEVLVSLRFARTRVQQLFPVPDHIFQLVSQGGDFVPQREKELPWTVLDAKKWQFDEHKAEVEPGEAEVLNSDFVIPTGVQQILLYTYVNNQAKRDSEIGWSDTVVVKIE